MKENKLQYARDNYSIGDKIIRNGFDTNSDPVTIEINRITPESNKPHFFGNNNSIYLGINQIYCGYNNLWAINLEILK
jgi:hypothetical protein